VKRINNADSEFCDDMSSAGYVFRSGQVGFSLIEAMIAFAIVAIGLLAVTQFQASVLQSNAVARSRSEALHLAQEKIESLRNIRDEQEFATKLGTATTGTDQTVRGYATYEVNWEISPKTNPPRAIVAVEVSWTDADGETQRVNLITEIAEINAHKVGSLL
jgi:Tfp pilus assembly protein PilV